MMIDQHKNALRVPDPRQTVLEAGLDRQLMHRLGGVIVHHRPVNACFDNIARVHGLAGEVAAREQLLGHGLWQHDDSVVNKLKRDSATHEKSLRPSITIYW